MTAAFETERLRAERLDLAAHADELATEMARGLVAFAKERDGEHHDRAQVLYRRAAGR